VHTKPHALRNIAYMQPAKAQLALFPYTQMPSSSISRQAQNKRHNTALRYKIISQRVNQLYAQRLDGIRLDYDAILELVAADFGFSVKTVKRALKNG